VCFAFCSYPASAVEVAHITKARFSPVFVLVEISNRSDEIERVRRNDFLKAPLGINFRPNLDSTFQERDSFYDWPLNFGVWKSLAEHRFPPNFDVDGGTPALIDAQKNRSKSIHILGPWFSEARNNALRIDSVNDDLGAMRRNEFVAGESDAFAYEPRLNVADSRQNNRKCSYCESGNSGEVDRIDQPIEYRAKPFHRVSLRWFPWALLASALMGAIIAWLLVWRGKLWI
jgi:hypothetical protein